MTSTRHASEIVERGVKNMEEEEEVEEEEEAVEENDDFFFECINPWAWEEGNEWALLLLCKDDVLRKRARMAGQEGHKEVGGECISRCLLRV